MSTAPPQGDPRPAVDVVVPFAGSDAELDVLARRLAGIERREDDTLVIVDNRPEPGPAYAASVRVVGAPTRRSSYHARNVGARCGSAPWLLFLDADVLAPPDLLARYFLSPPGDRTAVLAGAIRDVPTSDGRGLAQRYAHLSRPLNDDNVWRDGFAYAQTASAMVRRAAFEAEGGFAEVRSGGDADLCFRLVQAGWELERRPEAVVEHRSRASVRGLARQYARYGAGSEWLDARQPGFAPARRAPLAVVSGALRGGVGALRAAARGRTDDAVRLVLDALCTGAFEYGRRRPNRPRDPGGRVPSRS